MRRRRATVCCMVHGCRSKPGPLRSACWSQGHAPPQAAPQETTDAGGGSPSAQPHNGRHGPHGDRRGPEHEGHDPECQGDGRGTGHECQAEVRSRPGSAGEGRSRPHVANLCGVRTCRQGEPQDTGLFQCAACGHTANADHNTAVHILARGLALARGVGASARREAIPLGTSTIREPGRPDPRVPVGAGVKRPAPVPDVNRSPDPAPTCHGPGSSNRDGWLSGRRFTDRAQASRRCGLPVSTSISSPTDLAGSG